MLRILHVKVVESIVKTKSTVYDARNMQIPIPKSMLTQHCSSKGEFNKFLVSIDWLLQPRKLI